MWNHQLLDSKNHSQIIALDCLKCVEKFNLIPVKIGNKIKWKKIKMKMNEKLSCEITNGNNKFELYKNNMKIMLLLLSDFQLKWIHFSSIENCRWKIRIFHRITDIKRCTKLIFTSHNDKHYLMKFINLCSIRALFFN